MASTRARVEDLVRECQRFAGDSSLVTTRSAHPSLLREFTSRLPDARDSQEVLIFRGILLEVGIAWATHVHTQFHKSHPSPCEFAAVDELWRHWKDRTLTPKLAFSRGAAAFLTRFDLTHPLCAAAKAKDIIDLRYNEPLQLHQLARMTGCHSAKLRRSFKEKFGLSIREYRTRVRVFHAARLAATSTVKIDAIAATVGFRSRRHFYDAFRRIVGCTPSEMRTCPPPQLERIVEQS